MSQLIDNTHYFSIDLTRCNITTMGMGYRGFFMPQHPLAQNNGMVALHRHVLSVQLKRWLTAEEAVHFIDGDKTNCDLTNLELILMKDRHKYSLPRGGTVTLHCAYCQQPFVTQLSRQEKRRHCSKECSLKSAQRLHLSPQELAEEVWSKPTVEIAAEHGVSDKAIEKWCKKYNIGKPPRGYWAKLAAGKISNDEAEGMKRAALAEAQL
jgi:hypothetical protein